MIKSVPKNKTPDYRPESGSIDNNMSCYTKYMGLPGWYKEVWVWVLIAFVAFMLYQILSSSGFPDPSKMMESPNRWLP